MGWKRATMAGMRLGGCPKLVLSALLVVGAGLAAAGGCKSSAVPSPFVQDPADAGDAAVEGGDAAGEEDPSLGPPCLDDAQCDDGIDCTFDACDSELARCRYTPDHSLCHDEVFCDGLEICDSKLGCREGIPVACDDDQTCTIDTCVESTRTCKSELRDADGDGDPDWSCGGGDCNDTDPAISSQQPEVCANGQDDDCDGVKDEETCAQPKHDTCGDALDVTGSGVFVLSLAAAKNDYSASCAGGTSWRDLVVAVVVPPGAPQDVDLVATSVFGSVALASAGQCGDASSETACDPGHSYKKGGQLSRLRLRSLAPGAHAVYVFGTGAGDVALKVQYLPASTAPTNETCGTAVPLTPGVSTKAEIIGVKEDIVSDCESADGELVYEISLTEPKDVDVWASSLDGYGSPALSLLAAPCTSGSDELTCNAASQAHVFGRALSAGKHYVAVSATAPTDLDLLLELSPPTSPPADESCASSAALQPNVTTSVPFAGHADDHKLGCLAGAVDAAYVVSLPVASDVLLVARSSDNDTLGVSLANPPCADAGDVVACGTSSLSPVRAAAHKVAPGSYRAVIESQNGVPATLTALVRAATAPTLVAFADVCQSAVKVPENGGFFLGNTANAAADYAAGCDLGGQGAGGAPEQMLRLELSAKKRVVLDMKGSAYSTLLVVRKAEGCPGPEVAKACAAGYPVDRSFLDLTLDAGNYFIQVDGYAGASGQWFLDVFVADP